MSVDESEQHALVIECEHVLAGTYASYLEDRGEAVPLWARVNTVAHADVSQLIAMASSFPCLDGTHRQVDSWEDARARMAIELLRAAAAAGETPGEVQAGTLIPLELLLARHGNTQHRAQARDPERLLAVVTATLEHHQVSPTASDEPS